MAPSLGSSGADTLFSRSNFVIGSRLSAEYFFSGTCCTDTFTLNVYDLAGNEAVCSVGKNKAGSSQGADGGGSGGGNSSSASGLTIAIGVCVGILALVIIVAVVAVIMIKNKRAADLEEMRASPQER